VICLYGFLSGDVFIKTQCYHHFHSHCLSSHLVASEKNYNEEYEKLPSWQQQQAKSYQVCISIVNTNFPYQINFYFRLADVSGMPRTDQL
jgi:uncharacterized protein (DUF1697 family)